MRCNYGNIELMEHNYMQKLKVGKKTVVPDNEILPFLDIFGTIREMEVGDIIVWPIKKMGAVKIALSRANTKLGWTLRSHTDKAKTTISICRLA